MASMLDLCRPHVEHLTLLSFGQLSLSPVLQRLVPLLALGHWCCSPMVAKVAFLELGLQRAKGSDWIPSFLCQHLFLIFLFPSLCSCSCDLWSDAVLICCFCCLLVSGISPEICLSSTAKLLADLPNCRPNPETIRPNLASALHRPDGLQTALVGYCDEFHSSSVHCILHTS